MALFIAGAGYVAGVLVQLLLPEQSGLFAITEGMTFGEIVFILWLLVKGVKLPEAVPSPK